MTNELLLWLLPLPPLLAFALIVLFLHRSNKASHTVAILGVTLSWLGSMVLFVRALGIGAERLVEHPLHQAIAWLPKKTGFLTLGVYLDPLTAVTLFFVAWTIVMIFVYSVGYHNYGAPRGDHDEKGLPPHGATVEEHGHKHKVPSIEPMYARFFAFVSLFAFGMYLLVVSDNLLTLFAGWEIMGLCSFLLIGFWFKKPSARDAAVKAFMTTRIGDVFMLLGIVYLYSQVGSLAYPDIFASETLHRLATSPAPVLGMSVAGFIGLLLFIGTVGKSAQWPLHVWLPDAMEGPTPVSAMIHAATMVSAGVYLILRIFPLLHAAAGVPDFLSPMPIIAFIGAFTALFAATIAVAQNDIKRVLAYSTISQLGYMVAAVGIGAYVAAAFHLVTHAFFKALLFLGSGSVIHGMEHGVLHTDEHIDPQNMYNMGGLKARMPITFWTFLIGGFALAGFPVVTAGFWSKDEILGAAFNTGHTVVFWTLAVAALLTAFYTMRQITLTFLGKPRTRAAEHAQETPKTMTVPLMVLAVFALGYGWIGVPKYFPVLGGLLPEWFQEWVGAALYRIVEKGEVGETPHSLFPLAVSILVSLGGLALGYVVYRGVERADQPDPLARPLGALFTLLKNKYYFDELYAFLFVRLAYWLAEVFTFRWLDRTVIDGVLHLVARASVALGRFLRNYIDLPIVNGFGDAVGEGTKGFGRSFRALQTGRVQQYMLVALAHLVAFLVLVYYFATMS